MKTLLLGMMIASMSAVSWSACTYNLDATQAELSATSSGGTRFPNVSGQKVSFNVTPVTSTRSVAYNSLSGAYARAVAQNPGAAGDATISPTGIFAYEYKIKVPLNKLPDNETTGLLLLTAFNEDGRQKTGMLISYLNMKNATAIGFGFTPLINGDNGPGQFGTDIQDTSDGYQRIGIYFNQDSRQMGAIVNGTNYGYFANYLDVPTNLWFMNGAGTGNFPENSPTIGTEVSVELITDHAQMTQAYPTGTKDICGNTI
ncbi:DUF4882 family protein [Acinetobacter sp. WZC-1]|uniref:DUF4882 family protein n=1 Tax=Acinetobacter sp. WZC-1 TaxID=3459034 RepID=UPI00403DF846